MPKKSTVLSKTPPERIVQLIEADLTDDGVKYTEGCFYADTGYGKNCLVAFIQPEGDLLIIPKPIQHLHHLSKVRGIKRLIVKGDLLYSGFNSANENTFEEIVFEGESDTHGIGGSAFSNSCALKRVKLPRGLAVISYNTFEGCCALTDIEIPDTVTTIYSGAFQGCTSLQHLSFPSVTALGSAFRGCTSLKELTVPDGVTALSQHCFQHCTALAEVSLPATLTKIHHTAFEHCPALKRVVFRGSKQAWERVEKGDWVETVTNHYDNSRVGYDYADVSRDFHRLELRDISIEFME
ncbi:MAG: leucine-rich repeat domain-containing protein [Clostridia bacterium]|nr:leucine-rich repeat domain-containing protein [Clostridia bacterium]